MKFLLFLVTAALLLTSLSFAEYTPTVKRDMAETFEGHNGSIDESVRLCLLDTVLIRISQDNMNVMLILWSDAISKLNYRIFVPTKILPLAEGSTWTDHNGNELKYLKGQIIGNNIPAAAGNFDIQITIDPKLEYVISAEANQSGQFKSYLKCQF